MNIAEVFMVVPIAVGSILYCPQKLALLTVKTVHSKGSN